MGAGASVDEVKSNPEAQAALARVDALEKQVEALAEALAAKNAGAAGDAATPASTNLRFDVTWTFDCPMPADEAWATVYDFGDAKPWQMEAAGTADMTFTLKEGSDGTTPGSVRAVSTAGKNFDHVLITHDAEAGSFSYSPLLPNERLESTAEGGFGVGKHPDDPEGKRADFTVTYTFLPGSEEGKSKVSTRVVVGSVNETCLNNFKAFLTTKVKDRFATYCTTGWGKVPAPAAAAEAPAAAADAAPAAAAAEAAPAAAAE